MNVPHPSIPSKPWRATVSIVVGDSWLTLILRPVRLVGSANVATSFGWGISGSGWCSRSKTIAGPVPAGVAPKTAGGRLIDRAMSDAEARARRAPASPNAAGAKGRASSENHSEPAHRDPRGVHLVPVGVF